MAAALAASSSALAAGTPVIVNLPATVPSNDAKANAFALTWEGSAVVDNALAASDSTDLDAAGVQNENETPYGAVWFKFTATAGGTASLLATPYGGSPPTPPTTQYLVYLFGDDAGDLSVIQAGPLTINSVEVGYRPVCFSALEEGEVYYVLLAAPNAGMLGEIELALSEVCVPPGTVAPDNDEIIKATALVWDDVVVVDNTLATTDIDDPVLPCLFPDGGQGYGSVWFTFEAIGTTAVVGTSTTWGPADVTAVAVYRDVGGTLTPIACSDRALPDVDDAGEHGDVCLSGLTPSETYYVEVVSAFVADVGPIEVYLSETCAPPIEGACYFSDGTCTVMNVIACNAALGFFEGEDAVCFGVRCLAIPANDGCGSAGTVSGLPVTLVADTACATDDSYTSWPCIRSGSNARNVWYVVAGTGGTIQISTCHEDTTFETSIAVFAGSCGTLECLRYSVDFDSCGNGPGGNAITSWCSALGVNYYVSIGGQGVYNEFGSVGVTFTDLGTCATPSTVCRADFDGNGVLNVADIFAFLSAYFAQDPSGDYDKDGLINTADIFAHQSAYFAGC